MSTDAIDPVGASSLRWSDVPGMARTAREVRSIGEVARGNFLVSGQEFGEPVRLVQLALRDRGYELEPHGAYDPATVRAVRDFQRRARIVVDGIVGPQTLRVLGFDLGGTQIESPATSQARREQRTLTGHLPPRQSAVQPPPATPVRPAAPVRPAPPATPAAPTAPAAPVEPLRSPPPDEIGQRVLAVAETYVGGVDYSRRDADGPHGWRTLQTIFRETAQLSPSDAEMQRTWQPSGKAWCGIFATHVWRQAGVYDGHWSLVRGGPDGNIQRYNAWDRRFGGRAAFEAAIRPGDIVIFPELSHHAIVVEVNGDRVTTIDGNTHFGRIVRTSHSLRSVVAFLRPPGATPPSFPAR